jgi:hypothetical protein
MPNTIPQPPNDGSLSAFEQSVIEFERHAVYDSMLADFQADHLELRVIALEAVLATRWPLRLAAAWRLGRKIRTSVAPYGWVSDSFEDQRIEAAGNEWLIQRAGG